MINVAVCGANGKMGKTVVKMVNDSENLNLTATIDIKNAQYDSINDAVKNSKIDVLVDFTNPDSVYKNSVECLNNGIRPVIGTTGLTDNQIEELKNLSKEKNIGCFIAPNFSTGAVLMMEFAKKAAKYFDNSEIIELHHNQKKDAPSGTAIKTAKMMSEEKDSFICGNCSEKELICGSRGGKSYSNIHIHSVRMPGYMASQEVLFGSNGQILSIRHDSTNRECYMDGVKLAIEYIAVNNKFVWGLENIL